MNMAPLKKKPTKEWSGSSPRPRIVAALDIGSTKISCFIARLDPSHSAAVPVRVLGIGHHLSQGVRAGTIVDMELAEEAIRAAVDNAERMAGTTVRHVYVSVSCGQPESQRFSSDISVVGHEITDNDLRAVLRAGRARCHVEGRTVLHALPTGYRVDGHGGIRDPRGMFGERLSVDMHLVTAAPGPVRNLAVCIERCHLDPVAFIVAPYASGLACLVEDELDLGVTCIDMGGGSTSIGVFNNGSLVHVDVVPIGGQHVTNDIARGLSTPVIHAERMKTLYGSALASPKDEREMIDVPQVGEEDSTSANHIPKSILTGIIQPRLEETFELVRDRLKSAGLGTIGGRRVVLTGGASQMTGAPELAARLLDKTVRRGKPIRLSGLAESTGGPGFSTCAGLLTHALVAPPEAQAFSLEREGAGARGQINRFGRWLKEYF